MQGNAALRILPPSQAALSVRAIIHPWLCARFVQSCVRCSCAHGVLRRDGLGLKCPATVRKGKTAGARIAPKDEHDKENVDNGGKSSRSKRSMKSTASKNDDDDVDVFDPENDQQFQQPPSKAAKVATKGKPGSKGGDQRSEDDKSTGEREKELSKLKVGSPPCFVCCGVHLLCIASLF